MWTNRTTTAQFLAGKRTPCAVAVVAAAVLSPSSYTYSQLVPNSFIFGGYNFIKYALTDRTWNNQGTREKGEWGMGNGRNNHTTNNDVIYGEKLEFIAVRPLLAHPIRIHLHYCYCSSICRAVLWWHNGSPCHLLGFYCASDLRSFTCSSFEPLEYGYSCSACCFLLAMFVPLSTKQSLCSKKWNGLLNSFIRSGEFPFNRILVWNCDTPTYGEWFCFWTDKNITKNEINKSFSLSTAVIRFMPGICWFRFILLEFIIGLLNVDL